MAMMKTKPRTKRRRNRPGNDPGTIARYKSEAKEIAAAKQAMDRTQRGIEFEPERSQYVTDLRLL